MSRKTTDSKRVAYRKTLQVAFVPNPKLAKFVPVCGQKYTTNVSCRLLVEDCDKDNSKESKEMGKCLEDKGQASADIICALNPKCTKATLLGVTETRNVCKGRVWDVDAQWTFVCS